MKLPKRKHDGCDPMCGECCEWMERVIEKTKPATAEAFKAFWNVIEAMLPEVDSKKFSNFSGLYEILEEEVGMVAVDSLPVPAVKAADGRRAKARKRYEPAGKGEQGDAVFLPFGK